LSSAAVAAFRAWQAVLFEQSPGPPSLLPSADDRRGGGGVSRREWMKRRETSRADAAQEAAAAPPPDGLRSRLQSRARCRKPWQRRQRRGRRQVATLWPVDRQLRHLPHSSGKKCPGARSGTAPPNGGEGQRSWRKLALETTSWKPSASTRGTPKVWPRPCCPAAAAKRRRGSVHDACPWRGPRRARSWLEICSRRGTWRAAGCGGRRTGRPITSSGPGGGGSARRGGVARVGEERSGQEPSEATTATAPETRSPHAAARPQRG